MSNTNFVFLTGRLGASPEKRHTRTGGVVTNARLATESSRKDSNGQWVKDAQWHRLVCFQEKLAERLASQEKGALLSVRGEIRYETYKDRDNVEKTTTQILVESFTVLVGASKSGSGNAETPAASAPVPEDKTAAPAAAAPAPQAHADQGSEDVPDVFPDDNAEGFDPNDLPY